MGQTHSNEVVTQRELYFKPRVSEANPKTKLTTQRHLEKYYIPCIIKN